MTRNERDKRLTTALYAGLATIVLSVLLFGLWAIPVLAVAVLGMSAPLLAWYRRVDTGLVGPE